MTSPAPTLTLTAKVDREFAWYRGGSVRYIGIEIKASELPAGSEAPPVQPLNLAVVVDASGSMSGAPIAAAKAGVEQLAQRLAPDARLSLVSFDDEPTVHLSGLRLSEGVARIYSALARIRAGSSTDLGAGWLEGVRCAAEVMERGPGFRNRVVVLSDGHANRGITDPLALAHHAEQLRIRGISSSAIGIGDGYSPPQLEAIASSGGGRLHRADTPAEIVEVLLGELAESERTVAEDISLSIRAPRGASIELVSAFAAAEDHGATTVALGSLAAGSTALAILRVSLPAGDAGLESVFTIEGSWRRPGESNSRIALEPSSVTISLARGEANRAQPRDMAFSGEVAGAWQTAIVRQAVQLNREGQYRLAQSYIQGQLRHFSRYCEGLPEAARLVAELEMLHGSIAREWDERYRKEAELSSYKMSRRERDVRAAAPASWAEAMPPQKK